ncbi:hypothetical protein Tsp_10396 [Trichinella spiralis]|uniref:hypothetical protein n=1 Tax=Trichinella spiralis TaxID=6334 RepID=UPI0001EFEAAA|nr:hypothetical protein Tsp_10396 [Trichinella spiralis]
MKCLPTTITSEEENLRIENKKQQQQQQNIITIFPKRVKIANTAILVLKVKVATAQQSDHFPPSYSRHRARLLQTSSLPALPAVTNFVPLLRKMPLSISRPNVFLPFYTTLEKIVQSNPIQLLAAIMRV